MPLYEIEHHVPLRDNQKDTLAKQITNIHSRLFTTPSLFVNIRFLDKSESRDFTYVSGKRVCPVYYALCAMLFALLRSLYAGSCISSD